MNKYIKNENGATSFIVLGLFIGFIILGFIFFDMTSVFMERRMSQTGSDSAAIAAALKAEEVYEKKVRTEAEYILDGLKAEVDALREEWEELKANAGAEEDEEDTEPVDLPTWDEYFHDHWLDALPDRFGGRSVPDEIVGYVQSGFGSEGFVSEVDINIAMKFFWDEEEISDMICEEVNSHKDGEIRKEAREFADLNGIEKENEISVVFPVEDDEFKIGIRTKGTINDSFIDSVDTENLKVPANAVVEIQEPKDIDIVCNNL